MMMPLMILTQAAYLCFQSEPLLFAVHLRDLMFALLL